jgi:hypothetical protein
MVSDIVEPLQGEETVEERAQRVQAEQQLTTLVAACNELVGRKAAMVAAEDVRLSACRLCVRRALISWVSAQFEGAAAVKVKIDSVQARIRELEQLRASSKARLPVSVALACRAAVAD